MDRRKGWYIKQNFTNDFVDTLQYLYDKYGEDIFEIQGIANKHMDLVQFSKNFFGKSGNVADLSIDANANIKEKNVTQYNYENNKALMKLNSLYLMFKYIKKNFTEEDAKEALEKVVNGELFINDLSNFGMTYCYAFDLRNLLSQGMNFFKGNMNIKPPKRSESLIALLIQSVAYISNQLLGACSFPDLFVVLDWFYRREMGDNYLNDKNNLSKIKNQFQNLIYSLNFPFRGNQSLKGSEEIIVNNKTVSIGDFVESYLLEDEFEKNISNTNSYTYSFNPKTGCFESKKITGVIKHECNDKYLVQYNLMTGQTFEGTEKHSLFTRKNLSIVEVTANDNVDNIIIPYNFCKEEDIRVSTLDVPDVGGRLPIKKLILTPEIMYMFGQYIGDGCISGSRLTISTFNDKINQHLIDSVGVLFKTHVGSRGDIGINVGINVASLIKSIFGSGSHNKRIPRDWYFEENILYLIAGYIDADGHYRKNKGDIKISSCNSDLLKDVQFILLSKGIISRLSSQVREGFGIVSEIFKLTISAIESIKLNKYIVLKTPEITERLDYSRQMVDFAGVYQYIMNEYNIRGLSENNIISDRGRDKSLSLVDFNKIIEWLIEKINDDSECTDLEYMKKTLCPLYQEKDYSKQIIVSKNDRKIQLNNCLNELKKFKTALPIKVTDIIEIDAEPFVYDISVEDNENFLTANNIYAHNSSFTNVSIMDSGFLSSLFKDYVFPDFSIPNLKSSKNLSKTFFEYFTEINSVEGIFTFPVTTIAISLDEQQNYIDPEFVDWAAEINSKKALANIFQDKPTSFSSCCRLRSDYSKIADTGYQNSFGVGGLSIGSLRVAGLNLPRIALLEKEDSNIVEKDLEVLHKILYSHRQLISERIEGGYLPLYSSGWINKNRQYSTIGFIGGYEYVENKGLNITTKKGTKSLQSVLLKIEDAIVKWQTAEKLENNIYNLEEIPGESMAIRLADIDYILGYNKEDDKKKYELYSNQYIPLVNEASIYDRFRIQGEFDSLTSGGAILHINVDDEKPISKEQFKKLMDIARQLKTTYFAINYAYSECEEGHFSIGKHTECPICKKNIIQQFSRVVGFITPVKSWSKIRREYEYPRRVFYKNGALEIET